MEMSSDTAKPPDYLVAPIIMPEFLKKIEAEMVGTVMVEDEEKIRFAIFLAEENVRNGGGPFGAAVFSSKSHELCAVGVNVVVPAAQSNCHAEMTAIARMEANIHSHSLKGYLLASSCEPCVMCFGGILWSGLDTLLYGAPGDMAMQTGFDEGDKVPAWQQSLVQRNISIRGPLLTSEAEKPFLLFRQLGGKLY